MKYLLPDVSERMSQLLQAISAPARLEILLAIGLGEACVCHLEANLGYRQAYISQHLMALRDAGVIAARRDGRFMYYRLQNQELLELMNVAGKLCGIRQGELEQVLPSGPDTECACPKCTISAPASLVQIDLPESVESSRKG
jgi:DNA-binding transcriptional ArsR family regulator